MLQYSTYSVVSPEGCASILWRSAEKAKDAAEALSITSSKLKKLGLIDAVIEEPLGSAYRDADQVAQRLKENIQQQLDRLNQLDSETMINKRYQKLMSYGAFSE